MRINFFLLLIICFFGSNFFINNSYGLSESQVAAKCDHLKSKGKRKRCRRRYRVHTKATSILSTGASKDECNSFGKRRDRKKCRKAVKKSIKTEKKMNKKMDKKSNGKFFGMYHAKDYNDCRVQAKEVHKGLKAPLRATFNARCQAEINRRKRRNAKLTGGTIKKKNIFGKWKEKDYSKTRKARNGGYYKTAGVQNCLSRVKALRDSGRIKSNRVFEAENSKCIQKRNVKAAAVTYAAAQATVAACVLTAGGCAAAIGKGASAIGGKVTAFGLKTGIVTKSGGGAAMSLTTASGKTLSATTAAAKYKLTLGAAAKKLGYSSVVKPLKSGFTGGSSLNFLGKGIKATKSLVEVKNNVTRHWSQVKGKVGSIKSSFSDVKNKRFLKLTLDNYPRACSGLGKIGKRGSKKKQVKADICLKVGTVIEERFIKN